MPNLADVYTIVFVCSFLVFFVCLFAFFHGVIWDHCIIITYAQVWLYYAGDFCTNVVVAVVVVVVVIVVAVVVVTVVVAAANGISVQAACDYFIVLYCYSFFTVDIPHQECKHQRLLFLIISFITITKCYSVQRKK